MGLKLEPFGFQAATDRSILCQEKRNMKSLHPFMDKPSLHQLAVVARRAEEHVARGEDAVYARLHPVTCCLLRTWYLV